MKIFSTIFFAFILISTFSAPQTAHAGFIADAVSSVVGAVGDAIGGAIDIAGNLIDNVTSITSGIFQGSINLITGGSFSDGYKQGFCNLGGGGYGILNGGGCDSSTQFWKIVSSSDSNGSITPAGTTVVEQGQSVVYKIVSGPITKKPLPLSPGCVETMIPTHSKISNVFLRILGIKSAEAATTLALPSGGVNCVQRYSSTHEAGWMVTSLMVDGVNQSAAKNTTTFAYTFDTVSADHTISVTFALASAPSVVEVFGVCDNTGGYNCAPGTASSQSGNATNGWTWNCDGTPNDAAHRATGCFYKPTPAAVTPTCTTVWTANSKACNLYSGYTNYTGNVSFQYDSCNLNNVRNIDTSGCVAPATSTATSVSCNNPNGTKTNYPAGTTCPTWTKYCTETDATATPPHPWQIWAYTNPLSYSSQWMYVEKGTATNSCSPTCANGGLSGPVNCPSTSTVVTPVPPATWIDYCTGGNDVNGNYWQIWKCNPDSSGTVCIPGTEVSYIPKKYGTPANGCVLGGTLPNGGTPSAGSGTSGGGTSGGGIPVGGTSSGGTPGVGDLTCSKGGIPNTVGTCPNGGSLVCNTSTPDCQSAPNNCGLIDYGTYTVNCHGTITKACDAVRPANITPTATIQAKPNRVKPNGQTTISLTATGINTCTLKKNGEAPQSLPVDAATCTLNRPQIVDTVTDQSTYLIFCQDQVEGNATATQIVNVDPNFYEF